MNADQIRQTFLTFFEERGHAIIPSAPVVPQHDPTVLFTTAGMHPLVPYLLGEPHPAGKRLADVQKCVRTSDIDEVGDATHLTFFEMLGNWSLGDYFKEDAIKWSWELLTSKQAGFGLDPAKMAVSCFAGDKATLGVPKDEEAAKIWRDLGVPEDRIFYYGKDDNWWGPAGETGPCGPDTEVFYWIGEGKPELKPGPAEDDQRWVEVWNNVFMQYEKTADGKFESLVQKNVDTGMGLERLAVILQGKKDVYETDLFSPIIEKIRKLSNVERNDGKNTELERAERIIADHLKAATFMIADGVRPSNTDRGYILRRLVRRAVRQGKHLETDYPFTEAVAEVVVAEFAEAYPELKREAKSIRDELLKEEEKFAKTLDKSLRELEKELPDYQKFPEKLTGGRAFHYFETYGMPLEVFLEEAKRFSIRANTDKLQKDFAIGLKQHQEKSRAGAQQKFAGGLADHSEKVVRQHTATHLLLAALRDVLGDHVKQRGSNITAERLRFDFSHPEKLTDEQRNQVEALVNEWIREDLPVTRQEMPLAEAERIGAQMEFGHKYPDTVSVYFVGDPAEARSIEFCGGPHVERTGEIGTFKLKKQESVAAGVRRLKAIVD